MRDHNADYTADPYYVTERVEPAIRNEAHVGEKVKNHRLDEKRDHKPVGPARYKSPIGKEREDKNEKSESQEVHEQGWKLPDGVASGHCVRDASRSIYESGKRHGN